MRKGVLIAGIIILLIGLIGGIVLAVVGFSSTIGKDPASDNHYEITNSGAWMKLSRGDYEVWYDGLGIGDVVITDSGGQEVYITVKTTNETINGRSKYGSFEITTSGDYTISYSGSGTLYITDPISVGGGLGMVFGGIFGGIFVSLLGLIITVIGAVKKPRYRGFITGESTAPTPKKKCPQCGSMVEKTASFCPSCYLNL